MSINEKARTSCTGRLAPCRRVCSGGLVASTSDRPELWTRSHPPLAPRQSPIVWPTYAVKGAGRPEGCHPCLMDSGRNRNVATTLLEAMVVRQEPDSH